jgi:hypothetical protein
MRSSLIAAAIGFAVASFGVGGCAGCTPIGCGRNSDCPTGQVCSASAQCSLAPDASSDVDGGAAVDAASDAPADAATLRSAPDPIDRARYPRRHGRRHRPWRP